MDTNIWEVLAYASDICPHDGKTDIFSPQNEWNKLTPSQKEELIAKK
jgi:hypothetical protein